MCACQDGWTEAFSRHPERQRSSMVTKKGVKEMDDDILKELRELVGQHAKFFKYVRSEEHTSELQSHLNLVCRLLLEKKKKITPHIIHTTTPPVLHYIYNLIS